MSLLYLHAVLVYLAMAVKIYSSFAFYRRKSFLMPTHFSALLNSMQPIPHTDKHYKEENEYNIYLNKRGLYVCVNHHKFQKTEYSQIWCLCFSNFKKISPLPSSKTQDLSVKKQPEITNSALKSLLSILRNTTPIP